MTVIDEFPYLRELSPALSADLTVDGVVAVTDGEPGPDRGVTVTLASGERHDFRVTAVGAGLRLRTGQTPVPEPSPLLIEADNVPVEVTGVDGGVAIGAGAFGARWTADEGLVLAEWHTAPASGLAGDAPRLFGRWSVGDRQGWVLAAALDPDEGIFGGGESFQAVDLRGRVRHGLNDETHGVTALGASYCTVPFYWSVGDDGRGWHLIAHTGGPLTADLGSTHADVAAVFVEGDGLDVVVGSGDPAEHLSTYHRFSGLPGAVPDWGFGVWSSRCSYFSEAELHEVVDGYEAAGIPLAVVHVDCWLEGNTIRDLTCNWIVDRARFPEGWVERLAARGVRVSLWHNPFVLADSPLAEALRERGLLLVDASGTPCRTADKDDRVVLDLTNPEADTWWREQVRTALEREGHSSFKPDFAEEVPLDAVGADGRSGRAFRNEYSVRYQRATFETVRDVRGEAVLFCRSGTLGAQRYPGHWVGDSPSTWAGLTQAVRACLSLSLSGFGIVTSDAGGFFAAGSWDEMFEAADAEDPTPYRADVDHELFVRWSQWAALSPLLRFHGTGRREPWAYPDAVCAAVKAAIDVREALRPYLVAVADECAGVGTPMIRPPVLHAPDRRETHPSLQYLLGPDVLVAPLLTPGGRRRLWVPPGRWEPLLGLDPVEGDRWITVDCDRGAFPAWRRVS